MKNEVLVLRSRKQKHKAVLAKARTIIKKNQGTISEIINDEAKLVEYLTHNIHLDDETADHCLKTLYSIKEEKGWK